MAHTKSAFVNRRSLIHGYQGRSYTHTNTDSDGQKCDVSKERVYSLAQLHKGDHIAIKRLNGCYWHHAIVKDVNTEKGVISVIEYSYSVREFLQDNSSSPKIPIKAKVIRSKYRLKGGLYLIKHKKCLPADIVVERAISRLGEKKFCISNNNCEHFAMWCKTGISSSEQVKNIVEAVPTSDDVKNALSLAVAVAATQQIASKGGVEMISTTVREMTKEVVSQTVSKGGQEIMKAIDQMVSELVARQTVACAVLIEGAFAAHGIYRAKADLEAGKISQREYDTAFRKQIVGGVGCVAGSTAGAALGQVLIPIPVAGDFVGSFVGALVGRFWANLRWNVAK